MDAFNITAVNAHIGFSATLPVFVFVCERAYVAKKHLNQIFVDDDVVVGVVSAFE